MVYFTFFVLSFFCFFVVLNGFLQGRLRSRIDTVLSFLIIVLIVSIFFIWDWKIGLASIIFSFVSALVYRPLAARAANKLMERNWVERKMKFLSK